MLQFIPVFDGNTIAVRASGKLSHEDYQQFLPQLEEQIKTYDRVSMLLELDNFKGWELEAAKDDFVFGMSHFDSFDRIAVVGDKGWERWMVSMIQPFMTADGIQYFNRENLQQAWDWLRENDERVKAANHIQPYQSIVAAVDFSLFAAHASKRAIDIARANQATLTLLHVTEEYFPYSYFGDSMHSVVVDPELIKQQNQQHLEQAEKQMQSFVESLESDFDPITSVILGKTETTLVSYLSAQKVDLVVFGVKKKKGLSKFLGSIPHYVQNHAHCEILLVPLEEIAF